MNFENDRAAWTPRYLLTVYAGDEGTYSGYCRQVFREEPVPFTGAAQLFLKIEEDIRRHGQTAEDGRLRTVPGEPDQSRGGTAEAVVPKLRFLDETVTEPKERISCEAAHFLVTILYHQNATWQGEIHWREKRLRRNFRSCLELSRLIEEALGGRRISSACRQGSRRDICVESNEKQGDNDGNRTSA